ncbi:biotin--[acetyl-CoA-carboxylase] ligase [Serinicoccus sediminis]|uniref:biotin--[acetyl-CoA-carboxylase] ligase n=1 Tax=Serinicoccus sediminis TaxID=2306021 RepID=UPI00101F3408|nr:biotin--[acetyl-CoA-carboxylase] ligase [Serinicoccus sediminis]
MTRLRWATPERHESVGSTNVEAMADPRPGRVVVADHQSAGQGRRGRRWSSPPGTCLAVSAVVSAVPAAAAGWVPLAAGVAVVDALAASRWPVDAVLKWPNDVLLETGRASGKLCGVLVQVADTGDLVVGVGVNVDHQDDQLPVPTATSWRLARGGAPLPDGAREGFLEDYLHRLRELHDALARGDAGPVRTAYLQRCATLGRPVVVHRPDGAAVRGEAVGLDEGGALLVRQVGGAVVAHHAGDVEHLRDQYPRPHGRTDDAAGDPPRTRGG